MRDIKCSCGKVVARIKANKVKIIKSESIQSEGRQFEVKCSKCKKLVLGIIE